MKIVDFVVDGKRRHGVQIGGAVAWVERNAMGREVNRMEWAENVKELREVGVQEERKKQN